MLNFLRLIFIMLTPFFYLMSWAQMVPMRYQPETIGARIGDALFTFEWMQSRRGYLKLGYKTFNFERFGELLPSDADTSLFSYTLVVKDFQPSELFLLKGEQVLYRGAVAVGQVLSWDGKGAPRWQVPKEDWGGGARLNEDFKIFFQAPSAELTGLRFCVWQAGATFQKTLCHEPGHRGEKIRQLTIDEGRVDSKGAFIPGPRQEKMTIEYFYEDLYFQMQLQLGLRKPQLYEIAEKDEKTIFVTYSGPEPLSGENYKWQVVENPYLTREQPEGLVTTLYKVELLADFSYLNIEIGDGMALSYLVSSEKVLPLESERPQVLSLREGFYTDTALLPLKIPQGLNCDKLKSSQKKVVSQNKSCVWLASLKEKNKLNYPTLELRSSRGTFQMDYPVFYASRLYASGRLGGSVSSYGLAAALDLDFKYFFSDPNIMSWWNRFAFISQYYRQEMIVDFEGEKKLNVERPNLDLLYVFGQPTYNYTWLWGAGPSLTQLALSGGPASFQQSSFGLTAFVSMPPPSIVKWALNFLPFVARPKWGEFQLAYYPMSGGALITARGLGRFDLSPQWFWELGWAAESVRASNSEAEYQYYAGRLFLGLGGRF